MGFTHLQGLFDCSPWDLVLREPARLPTQGLAPSPEAQWLLGMSSMLPGTDQGSLCLLAEWWVGEQMPGVQPLPSPLHTVQSWVCSLHTSPLPPHNTLMGIHTQAPASVSTALGRDPRLLPGRLTPQLFPKASRMREGAS